jgi:hypothetical protein
MTSQPQQVMDGKVCDNCLWFYKIESYGTSGQCRRREPMIATIMVSTESYDKTREGTWPRIDKTDFCGAFQSKAPAFVTEQVKEAPVVTP